MNTLSELAKVCIGSLRKATRIGSTTIADHGGICLRVEVEYNLMRFIYQEGTGVELRSEPIVIFFHHDLASPVTFVINIFESKTSSLVKPYLSLQEALGKRLSNSRITCAPVEYSGRRHHSAFTLTTDIGSLFRLLSKDERARLLFHGNSCLRKWTSELLSYDTFRRLS